MPPRKIPPLRAPSGDAPVRRTFVLLAGLGQGDQQRQGGHTASTPASAAPAGEPEGPRGKRPLLTIDEVIAELRISRSAFCRWRRRGTGPATCGCLAAASGSGAALRQWLRRLEDRHRRTGSIDSYDVRSGTPGRSATPPKAAGGPARRINHELARLYPDAHIELDFTAPLELLEWRVAPENAVARGIFPRAASGTKGPPVAPARHVLPLADGPLRQACCVRCSSSRASVRLRLSRVRPNCEASRIYLRRQRAAGLRSRDAGNGPSVGQELARVVEEGDAVAQQAPPLIGVANDATGLGAVRPVGWGAWGPVRTHVVAPGFGTDSFHCRLLGRSPGDVAADVGVRADWGLLWKSRSAAAAGVTRRCAAPGSSGGRTPPPIGSAGRGAARRGRCHARWRRGMPAPQG